MKTHAVHFSSASDEWRTPPDLFAKLDAEFRFSLDAAATDSNALCKYYFTQQENALAQNWFTHDGGAIWCNPPYSRGLQAKFISKGRLASIDGATVVFLIPARPDTKVWHEEIFPHAAEIRFLAGRVRFVGAKASAPFPSAVVVFCGQWPTQKVRAWNWRAAS